MLGKHEELIDDGSWNGVKKYLSANDEGDVQVRYEGHDSDVIMDRNKAAAGRKKSDELWHIGHIPASVGLKWLAEEGLDLWNPHHADGITKKLMDSDYRYLVPGMHRIII